MYINTPWRPTVINGIYYPMHTNSTVMKSYPRLTKDDCESLCELMPFVLQLHGMTGAVEQMSVDQLMDLRTELNKLLEEIDRVESHE